MIPRPFGEVVRWRAFRRNERVVSDNYKDAMYVYVNAETRENLETPVVIKTINVGECDVRNIVVDDGSLQFDEDGEIHNVAYTCKGNKSIEVETGDFISFAAEGGEETVKAEELAGIIFQVDGVEQKEGVGDEFVNIISVRVTEANQQFFKELITVRPQVPMVLSDVKERKEHEDLYYIMVWACAFKEGGDVGNGWQGDPKRQTQKSKNSDEDSMHMEIVCMQKQGEVNSSEGFRSEGQNIDYGDWHCMSAMRSIMDTVAESMKAGLDAKYNEAKTEAFEAYTETIQTRISEAWGTTFGPLVHQNIVAGTLLGAQNYGGYVLLKPVRNNRENEERVEGMRLVNIVSAGSTEADNNNKVLINARDPEFVFESATSAETVKRYLSDSALFQVVGGSLDKLKKVRTSNLSPLDPISVSDLTDKELYCKYVVNEMSVDKFTTIERARPDELFDTWDRDRERWEYPEALDLPLRPTVEEHVNEVYERLQPVLGEGGGKMPHMDVKTLSNERHFVDEFKTVVKLVGQCLFATVSSSTPRQVGKPIVASIVTDLQKMSILGDIKADGGNTPGKVMCVVSQGKVPNGITAYVNEVEPWRDEDDGEYGACSKILYEPCLRYASRFLSSTVPSLPDIGSVIMSSVPFGSLESDKMSIITHMVEEALKSSMFNHQGKDSVSIQKVVMRSSAQADDMPYEPLVLQYGMHVDGENMAEGFSWSLGETPTIVVEAMQLVLVYLQKTMYEVYVGKAENEENNKYDKIKEREEASGWDTYPYGMPRVDQISGWRTEFEDTAVYNLRSTGEVRVEKAATTYNLSASTKEGLVLRDALSVPGTDNFCSGRGDMRKEVEYVDTMYGGDTIDDVEVGMGVVELCGHVSTNKWTGPVVNLHNSRMEEYEMCFIADEKPDGPSEWKACEFNECASAGTGTGTGVEEEDVYSVGKELHAKRKRNREITECVRKKEIVGGEACVRVGSLSSSSSSGVEAVGYGGAGYWETRGSELSAETYTQNRYRKYTGATPDPWYGKTMSVEERDFQEKHVGRAFNNTVKKTTWVLPEYKMWEKSGSNNQSGDKVIDELVAWMARSFVGWHHGSMEGNNTTEFAIACNGYYRKVSEYFNKLDVNYGEERGISVLQSSVQVKHEALLLKLLYGGRIMSSTATNAIRKPMVVQGVVMVKGNAYGGTTTKCVIEDMMVKTETYRIVESETWATLYAKYNYTRGIPPGSVRGCLGERIAKLGENRRGPLRMREIVRMRPEIVPSLARLMLALHVHNETWKNTKIPRYKESIMQGE